MEIKNSSSADIDEIFQFYAYAAALQKSKAVSQWQGFDRSMVANEIREQRQWRMIIEEQTACIWATTDSDAEIWEALNSDPAIYIHRIVTHPDFRGQQLVGQLVEWARDYGRLHQKKYLRMDTVGENKGLIDHYGRCGFDFLGLKTLTNSDRLPLHYQNATVSLFQLEI
ncbi:GNAT family N-acetyltransferase [Niabella terrae]